METLFHLFQAFGLSASAGLNAYIPLLVVALAARYTDAFTLRAPFDVLTSPWIIGVLVVLVVVEALADKIPLIDHMNDVIATVIRPAAGAIVFAGSAGIAQDMSPVLAGALGLLTAGAIHGVKATARPLVTASTGGIGNPVVSALEDAAATLTSLMAVFLPILVGLAFLAFALMIFWLSRRRRTGKPMVASEF